MATLDELRLEQLLSPFNKPQGIATLSQAASPVSFLDIKIKFILHMEQVINIIQWVHLELLMIWLEL